MFSDAGGTQILTELCPEAAVSPPAHFSDSPLQPSTRCSGRDSLKKTIRNLQLMVV